MLSLLKLVSDGQALKYRDLMEDLAVEFEATAEERKELLASGSQAIFDNSVDWAKTYLKKAGLPDSPKRATFQETTTIMKRLKQRSLKVARCVNSFNFQR